MIPKILHQVWIGPNPRRADHLAFHEGWRRLHPDWEFKLWTDDNIGELGLPSLDSWTGWPAKSDAVRIAAVLKYGGVYADTDTEFRKNFDPLLDQPSWVVNQQPNVICNGIFASRPGEEFLRWQMVKLPSCFGQPPPWGVYLMTSAALKFQQTITIYSPCLFLPYMYGYGTRPAADFPNAYSVHHWDSSRQHKPVAQRVAEGEHRHDSTDDPVTVFDAWAEGGQ